MKFLLGTKEYMTQTFDEDGNAQPVTAITVLPATVLQVKTSETDGYGAVQVGAGVQKKERLNKPLLGHFGAALKAGKSDQEAFRYVREVRTTAPLAIGETIGVDVFAAGDRVRISSRSKGKGFQGVVKRHGFAGGRRTHGQKHSEREPGSIGAGGVQRVLKGLRMAGRMGGDRTTVKNLTVIKVDTAGNTIYVRGAVPGRKGTLVELYGDE
jgi:large subunit ribosomal protein L3